MATFLLKITDEDGSELVEVKGTQLAFKRAYCDQNDIGSDAAFAEAMVDDGYSFVDIDRVAMIQDLV